MPENYTVQAFMSSQLVTLGPDMDVLEAVRILTERGIPGAPVVDDLGNLVGLLAEKDCLEAVLKASYHEEWGGRVSEYMQKEVRTVDAELSIFDAARLFIDTRLRGFPVVRDDSVIGQINRSDILKALIELSRVPFKPPSGG
jgi:predicted transcriptional regulator